MIYSLIILLLVLLLDRLVADRGGLNPFSWLDDWITSIEQRFNGGEVQQGVAATALTAGSIFLVVLLVQVILAETNWWLRVGFDILIMYFFIQVHARLEQANTLASLMASGQPDRAEDCLASLPPVNDEPVSDVNPAWLASARLLAGANHWFFAMVFWYLVLGPAGAVLYYVSVVIAGAWGVGSAPFQDFGRAAYNLHQAMSWLPVRILATSYALMGDFEHALASWRGQQDTWTGSNDQLLVTIGLGALGETPGDRHPEAELVNRTVALLYRVVVFWASVAALIAVAGFVS